MCISLRTKLEKKKLTLKGGVRPLGSKVQVFVFLFFFEIFFDLNCCTISCDISFQKTHVLSRLGKYHSLEALFVKTTMTVLFLEPRKQHPTVRAQERQQTTPQHRSTVSENKEWFLRCFSPETLQSMPRWVFTTSCVSMLLEMGRLSNKLTHGQDLHTLLSVKMKAKPVHEDAPHY